ncbi:Spermidine/putrescine-binding periplasmic protein precursor, partial [Haemophilus influenzae]
RIIEITSKCTFFQFR